MEPSSLKNHQILSLSKTGDNTYTIIDEDTYLGKLTIMLSDDSIAIFDNKKEKFIFKQIGFWKPIIKVCYFGENKVLYTLSCKLLKSTSVNILNNRTEKENREIYWEWHLKSMGETIISYSQSLDSVIPIIVKITAPEKITEELNILPALGCYFHLNYERLSTINQIPQLKQVKQFARTV
jgi:hypothetical protein